MKTILLGDIFIFGGNSSFLTKRLIVDTDSPINFETSFFVKNWLAEDIIKNIFILLRTVNRTTKKLIY